MSQSIGAYQLSPEQIASFQKDGFLLLRVEDHALVDPAALQRWSAEVKGWPNEKGKWMPYNEINAQGQPQLLRTEKFVDYHPEFSAFLNGEGLATILKQASGTEMQLFKDKINYKMPHGNGFAAHLDAPAYDHISKIEHLTANLAVDEATVENGCLEIIPGSHKMDVELSHGGQISKAWEDSHEWQPVPLKPGDILLFGSHLAHRSGPNNSDKPRSMVYATYAAKSDGENLRKDYYAHRRVEFPPDHERIEGKDYSSGWATYAFAAPFSDRGLNLQRGVNSATVH